MSRFNKALGGAALSLAALTMVSAPALATDGYFAHGFGARHKALGGAGAADGRDATTASLNPAGLVHVERDEFSMSVSAFSPRREYRTGGPFNAVAPFGVGGPATVESGKNWFAVPNMAYAHKMASNPYIDVLAFTVYGNGGMNSSYDGVTIPGSGGFKASVYGLPVGARTGINLEQAIISLAAAKKFGNVSVGLAPAVVRQQFRASGLQPFGVVDGGNDVSWGYGLRYGAEWAVMDNVRVGVTGNTRFQMNRFDKYETLFAQKGEFDIPASIQAGIAVDVMPNLTFMLDYKHIWYGSVAAIANPSSNIFLRGGGVTAPLNLGTEDGGGFGWKDVDVIKFGVEMEATDSITLRAGYSYNTSPLRKQDVSFNVLAPATVQHHITAGAEVDLNDHWSLELAGMYAPEVSVTGPDLFTGAFGGTETLSMKQYEITAGVKYKW